MTSQHGFTNKPAGFCCKPPVGSSALIVLVQWPLSQDLFAALLHLSTHQQAALQGHNLEHGLISLEGNAKGALSQLPHILQAGKMSKQSWRAKLCCLPRLPAKRPSAPSASAHVCFCVKASDGSHVIHHSDVRHQLTPSLCSRVCRDM